MPARYGDWKRRASVEVTQFQRSVQVGREQPRRVEALLGDLGPGGLAENLGVDLLLPEDFQLLSLGIIFEARQAHERLVFAPRGERHAFDEVPPRPDADDLTLLGGKIRGDCDHGTLRFCLRLRWQPGELTDERDGAARIVAAQHHHLLGLERPFGVNRQDLLIRAESASARARVGRTISSFALVLTEVCAFAPRTTIPSGRRSVMCTYRSGSP